MISAASSMATRRGQSDGVSPRVLLSSSGSACIFWPIHDREDRTLPFTASTLEELNLLLQFDSNSLERGIKVHSNARQEVITACQRLFDKGLVDQQDGGYLTDEGVEALSHAQVLAGLLGVNKQA